MKYVACHVTTQREGNSRKNKVTQAPITCHMSNPQIAFLFFIFRLCNYCYILYGKTGAVVEGLTAALRIAGSICAEQIFVWLNKVWLLVYVSLWLTAHWWLFVCDFFRSLCRYIIWECADFRDESFQAVGLSP